MEFRLLGPVEVVSNGTRLLIGGRKQRAVLAVLLLRANQVVPRESLIDSLWGEAPPETARASLNVYVSRLRKLLASSGSRTQLATRAHGYVLDVADELDLRRFEQLVADAKRAAGDGDAGRASDLLRDALALWRGPALADLSEEPFAKVEQGRLEELRLRAFEERLEADLALGRHADVVSELERLVAEHPYRERFQRQLMLALYGSGRQADALAAYRDARRRFSDELGIEPGPQLQELEQAILRHEPTLAPARARPSRETHQTGWTASTLAESTIAVARRHRWVVAVVTALSIVVAAAVTVLVSRGSQPLTSIGPNAVGVVDPATDALIAEVQVGSQLGVSGFDHGGSAAVGFGSVWVASSTSRTISRIDTRTRAATSIGVASEAVNVAAGMGAVWVTHRFAGMSRIDPDEETATETLPLTASDGLTYAVEGIAVGAGAVWVGATRADQLRLLRIDPDTREVQGDISVGVRSAHDLALGEGAVWVTNTLANRVLRVHLSGRRILDRIALAGPTSLAVGGGAVWVTSEIDNSVWRIDPETDLVTDQIHVGKRPVDVAYGEGAVWVANSLDGTLSRIDPHSRKVTATIHVGPTLAAVTVGRGSVWAVSGGHR
jgi:YVTN family beta-propeller protein